MSAYSQLLGEWTLNAIRTDVRHPFDNDASGVAIHISKDGADKTVFIFEDPDDGYRSSAAAPIISDCPMYSFGCSPDYLNAPVTVSEHTASEYGGQSEGLEFRDRRNGKVILIVGTDNTDDYYPTFVCDWRPQDIAENAP